jgi:hypothetical protein
MMPNYEKRLLAMKKVLEDDPGEIDRIEEIFADAHSDRNTPKQYLVVEWADENLAYDAYTVDMLDDAKADIASGGNSGDSAVTDFSVHDLDDGGKEVGKVVVNIVRTFHFVK